MRTILFWEVYENEQPTNKIFRVYKNNGTEIKSEIPKSETPLDLRIKVVKWTGYKRVLLPRQPYIRPEKKEIVYYPPLSTLEILEMCNKTTTTSHSSHRGRKEKYSQEQMQNLANDVNASTLSLRQFLTNSNRLNELSGIYMAMKRYGIEVRQGKKGRQGKVSKYNKNDMDRLASEINASGLTLREFLTKQDRLKELSYIYITMKKYGITVKQGKRGRQKKTVDKI